MDSVRVNKRIFKWCDGKSNRACKNWGFKVKEQFKEYGLTQFCDISNHIPRSFPKSFSDKMMDKFRTDWSSTLNNDTSRRGKGGNKLRTYRLFKSEFKVEDYCKLLLPLKHRSAYSKFRCGVAPIRIETGRYEGLPVEGRICPFCGKIENEIHVLLDCSVYNDIRVSLLDKASDTVQGFNDLSNVDKFKILLSHHMLIRFCAKTCFNIIQRRYSLLFK